MIESVLSCSCHDVAKYWPVGMTRQEESTALRDVIISYLFFNFFIMKVVLVDSRYCAPNLCESLEQVKPTLRRYTILKV